MPDAHFPLHDFFTELRELTSSEVTSDWRRLPDSEIVYLQPVNDYSGRRMEAVFGAEDCQLSIGDLWTREISLTRATEISRVQRLVVGAMSLGITVWTSRRRKSIAVGNPDEHVAQAHLGSRTAPTVLTRWEPWVSPAVRPVLVSRFGDGEPAEWL